MTRKVLLLAILLLFSLCPSAGASAQSQHTGSRMHPSQQKLLWDFLNIAVSNEIWLGDTADPWQGIDSIGRTGLTDSSKPFTSWDREFSRREKGLPRSNAVVKWDGDVRIAIGWPRYGTPDINNTELPFKSTEIIESQVTTLSPELAELTGLSIQFVDSDDPAELTDRFARVRIIPVHQTGLHNYFKTLRHQENMILENQWYFLQSSLPGAIPFTAGERAQVDGLILPNADNTIGLALCFVLDSLPEAYIRALVSECLVRSMGLPEVARAAPDEDALLARWNARNEADALLQKYEGDRALLSAVVGPDYIQKRNEFLSKAVTLPVGDVSERSKLTEYDRQQLRLLYCDSVKPGMDKYQVVIALYAARACLDRKGQ